MAVTKRILAIMVAALWVCVPSLAETTAFQELESKVKLYTLPNGLRVIFYERGLAPVFSGAVVVRVGGVDEGDGQSGISHLFEHMAFKGTRTIGTRDFERERVLLAELETIAADSNAANSLNEQQKTRWKAIHKELQDIWITDDFSRKFDEQGVVGLNATTDKEMTKYFSSLPRSAFEFWCRMESDRLRAPILRQFYQERDVVLEERRMRYDDDPGGKLYESLLSLAYVRHPYRNPVIGYESDIRGLTATNLEAFRRRYYVPSNIVIALVGRVNPEEDIKVIQQFFGDLPAGQPPARWDRGEVRVQGEKRFVVRANAAPQVLVAYHKPNYPHADDPPISVMHEILAGGKVSPLYLELVQRRQVAADISIAEAPGVASPNLFLFAASLKNPHTTEDFMEVFDSVVAKFLRQGPTQEQLEIAKRSIQMSFLQQLDSSQSIALDLASAELLFGSWKAQLEWIEKAMSVTVEDVQRVAQQYLQNDFRLIGAVERGSTPPT
jgi:predicted Zn-dependent peptidase